MSEGQDPTPVPELSKEELFKDNPERFEDLKNCLLVVKRDPETKKLLVLNQSESIEESFVVEGYIKDAMAAFRNAVRLRVSQHGIVKPKSNGFMNGLRGMKR